MLPSGKHTKNDGESPFFMGKLTISMAIFNSKLSNHHRLEFNLKQSRPSTLIALSVNPFPAQTRLKRIDSTLKGLRTRLRTRNRNLTCALTKKEKTIRRPSRKL
jgi:hypothetical protein